MLIQDRKKFFIKAAKMLLLSVIVLAAFLIVRPVLAATLDLGLQFAAGTGLGNFDIRIMIARIIRIFLGLVGIVMIGIILYAGFIYMTSAGDKDKTARARKMIVSAVIGLAIILSAYSIASFILNSLLSATTGGGAYTGAEPYGSAGGALGGGIIESHFPVRNAIDVARNTKIVISFKEAMQVNTLISDTNNNNIYGDCVNNVCDQLNSANVKIFKTTDGVTNGPFVVNVKANKTTDDKIFVFTPATFLGSETEKFNYSVFLSPNLKKFNGQGAFGNFGSYTWSFLVGTTLDLIPPRITSVVPVPSNSAVPKNSVVQINFSEPINPISLMGLANVAGAQVGSLSAGSFDLITVSLAGQTNKFVAGKFSAANQYQSAEFVTNDPCGISSCGEAIYCLPGNAQILVRAKAADTEVGKPTAVFPYTGIVDMADNSLDGNGNGTAVGPQSDYNLNNPVAANGDNLIWTFVTNDYIDLVPPKLEGYTPGAGTLGANPISGVDATFDKLMMSSSIKPDSGYGDGYCPCAQATATSDCGANQTCSPTKGYCVDAQLSRIICTPTIPCAGRATCVETEHATLIQPASNAPRAYWLSTVNNSNMTKTTMTIGHEILLSNALYTTRLGSGLKDLWQNCFQPAGGPGCVPRLISPGQYEASSEWTIDAAGHVTYPTCDLTKINFSSFGNFTLSYDVSGANKIKTMSAFSSTSKSAVTLYSASVNGSQLQSWGEPFTNMLAARRTAIFLYHYGGANYLFFVNSTTASTGVSGNAEFSFSGMPASASIALKDDRESLDINNPGDTYPDANFVGPVSWSWIANHTDGMIVYMGPDNQAYSITITPGNFTNINEIIFYYPGGSVSLPKNKAFSIAVSQ